MREQRIIKTSQEFGEWYAEFREKCRKNGVTTITLHDDLAKNRCELEMLVDYDGHLYRQKVYATPDITKYPLADLAETYEMIYKNLKRAQHERI